MRFSNKKTKSLCQLLFKTIYAQRCLGLNVSVNLVMAMKGKSGDHQSLRIHLLGTMYVGTEFHGNPSNSCWDISVWTKVVDRPTNWCCHPSRYAASMAKVKGNTTRCGQWFSRLAVLSQFKISYEINGNGNVFLEHRNEFKTSAVNELTYLWTMPALMHPVDRKLPKTWKKKNTS